MAAGQGQIIQASDYNGIKSKVDTVFGVGGTNPLTNTADSTFGYGQTITSPTMVTGNSISHNEWILLRNDMVKARQHQTGVTVGYKHPTDPGYVANQNLIIPGTTD